jgi:predicted membrane channel-forming protein YqfA (hemolysin III family)
MSRRARPPDPSRSQGDPQVRPRRTDLAVALFVTVLWAAVVFAVDGLLSVTLDRDPITGAVSPFYGIVALGLAAIVLWLVLIGTARSATPWFGTLAAAAGVYLVLVASALPVGLVLVGQQAGSPFVIATAVLAALTVVATWSITRRWGPSAPK